MCYHRLYIHLPCGHTFLSPTPIRPPCSRFPRCTTASSPRTHPFQTFRLYCPCAACAARLRQTLAELERANGGEVGRGGGGGGAGRVGEDRWRVTYVDPRAEARREGWGVGAGMGLGAESQRRDSGVGSGSGSGSASRDRGGEGRTMWKGLKDWRWSG
ncbi:hypothetical protein BDY21DRAFT_337450 [Lineolata rhizophorae]|uniref:Uncharacterized protein n=1 Tax=Lineolata rhizophorae TaxID=578093 RepID=A0A6A6P829_9PEZI|nr:hypothetical protein BDY21DRAFT_337450 [Lineolata rhizophorae]